MRKERKILRFVPQKLQKFCEWKPYLLATMVFEEILLEQPDNQKQLHLLVDLVDDAGGNLCGGAKDDIHELPQSRILYCLTVSSYILVFTYIFILYIL